MSQNNLCVSAVVRPIQSSYLDCCASVEPFVDLAACFSLLTMIETVKLVQKVATLIFKAWSELCE